MITVLGLDVATRTTGVALPSGRTLTLSTPLRDVARRIHWVAGSVTKIARSYRPMLVMLEGYAPNSHGTLSTIRLAEVGGAVRLMLFELGVPYIEIPPSQLKRFATGNGNASKEAMIEAAYDAGGDPRNHDEADAYLLHAMGRMAYGDDLFGPDGRAHRIEVLASITWPRLSS